LKLLAELQNLGVIDLATAKRLKLMVNGKWLMVNERKYSERKSIQICVANCKTLSISRKEKKEFVMLKQVLRSGTSIGANIEEANQAQSKSDFIYKLSISQKESFETHYWIRILRDSDFLVEKLADSLLEDCEEIQKLITSSIKTAKINLQK
jgi:four helix bundle protein